MTDTDQPTPNQSAAADRLAALAGILTELGDTEGEGWCHDLSYALKSPELRNESIAADVYERIAVALLGERAA